MHSSNVLTWKMDFNIIVSMNTDTFSLYKHSFKHRLNGLSSLDNIHFRIMFCIGNCIFCYTLELNYSRNRVICNMRSYKVIGYFTFCEWTICTSATRPHISFHLPSKMDCTVFNTNSLVQVLLLTLPQHLAFKTSQQREQVPVLQRNLRHLFAFWPALSQPFKNVWCVHYWVKHCKFKLDMNPCSCECMKTSSDRR